MSKDFDTLYDEYLDRFDKGLPLRFVGLHSQEEWEEIIKRCLKEGKPYIPDFKYKKGCMY